MGNLTLKKWQEVNRVYRRVSAQQFYDLLQRIQHLPRHCTDSCGVDYHLSIHLNCLEMAGMAE
ncbi:MAG: hypothetical protein LVT47_14435 [Cyanobacteria bacterium LVE1205-1]